MKNKIETITNNMIEDANKLMHSFMQELGESQNYLEIVGASMCIAQSKGADLLITFEISEIYTKIGQLRMLLADIKDFFENI